MSNALTGPVTALFARHVQESLSRMSGTLPPLWQYVCAGSEGPALLSRAAPGAADGAPAVVWGLVLPSAFVTSSRFALQPCIGLFPADETASTAWPAPVDLSSLPAPAAHSEAAERLAGAYIEAGELRVPPATDQPAVMPLCQLVELLPPADRLEVSFSTAPLGLLRRVEMDPSLPPGSLPASAESAQALLWLSGRLRAIDMAAPALSRRLPPEAWLVPLLQGPDLPARVVRLLRLLDDGLPGKLREPIMSWWRKALEQQLAGLGGSREVSATLEELARSTLLARTDLFPPLWAARVAMKLQVLGSLSADTLAQILRPDAVPLLLAGLRQGPADLRTADLVAALAHAPASLGRRLLEGAGMQTLAQLCAQPEALEDDGELACAIAVLALYFSSGPDSPGPPGQSPSRT
jgi:hypothetical protein